MIVTVYAIAKNEEKFVGRWVQSMREADHLVVLDTGSTDGTVAALEALGVRVKRAIIKPWRFDTARNASMKLIPFGTDICVCTDLDEMFEAGWRQALERGWKKGTRQARYRYVWSHLSSGGAGVEFFIEKAHSPKGFRWVNPVHEVLECSGKNSVATIADMTLHHFPDESKSRAEYLPLLELAVKENPDNDRNTHYLGREYMFRGRYEDAIETLTRHLSLLSATWADERAASMRYIARCYLALGQSAEAEVWLMRAVAEAPRVREPYVEYAQLLYQNRNWAGAVFFLERALAITERSSSYINEPICWGALPYDLLSLAYYYLGDIERAKAAVDKAIGLSSEPRLKDNRRFFEKALGETEGKKD